MLQAGKFDSTGVARVGLTRERRRDSVHADLVLCGLISSGLKRESWLFFLSLQA
jgi:hypothetical protein